MTPQARKVKKLIEQIRAMINSMDDCPNPQDRLRYKTVALESLDELENCLFFNIGDYKKPIAKVEP